MLREPLNHSSRKAQELFSVYSKNHSQRLGEHFKTVSASDDESDADNDSDGSEGERNFFHMPQLDKVSVKAQPKTFFILCLCRCPA